MRTNDGRVLSVVEGGDGRGKPVFVLHGTPGSRMLYGRHATDASNRGIRLISYDRPGYGGSTPLPGRKVADVAKDVVSIADHLGVERFAVWGISGGGPHALACAARIPKRVVAAASLASPAPYPSPGLDWLSGQGEDNVAEFSAAMEGPERLDQFLVPLRVELLKADPVSFAKVFESLLPPVDKAVLSGELGDFLISSLKEGVRAGYEGWKEDDLAFVSDWGFKPADVSAPLLIWQGKEDKMVPFAHGLWLAEHIPGAEARLSQEDGHLTLIQRRVPETHAWLLRHF
ncbi:MAG: alpha/beta hydrolase [Thaumarchaeota archaeon]|nr:alpha/beta hydrolase [Nitrososphaerota archaeon]